MNGKTNSYMGPSKIFDSRSAKLTYQKKPTKTRRMETFRLKIPLHICIKKKKKQKKPIVFSIGDDFPRVTPTTVISQPG